MATSPDVQYLSITAVTFSTLSGLFGIYLVLFVFAVWATFRRGHGADGRAHKRLRIVTIILFVDLTVHLFSQAILFARSRIQPAAEGEDLRWTIPLSVVQGLTTTLAGLLSDGLLAWRFYVIFQRKSWSFWIPTSAILFNTLLALSANLLPSVVYRDQELYENKIHKLSLQISSAWGWTMFAMHTLLTGSILARIIYIAQSTRCAFSLSRDPCSTQTRLGYPVVLYAIIESSLVTWIGLLMYEIASFAPTGSITTNLGVGYVLGCILPVFFGISQCLITTRIGFADIVYSRGTCVNGCVRHNVDLESTDKLKRGVRINIEREVQVSSDGHDHAQKSERPDLTVSVPPKSTSQYQLYV